MAILLRFDRLAVLVLSIVLVCASCAGGSGTSATSPAPERDSLHVVNVDGPDVSVLVADTVVGSVPCGRSTSFVAGGSLPALPWNVTVKASDGAVLGTVPVTSLPGAILVRGRGVVTGPWPMSYGPAPTTTCALVR